MAKTAEQVKELIEALEDEGFEVRSYSGRNMFGKQCVSVRSDEDAREATEWEIAKALFSEEYDGKWDSLPAPHRDQLGLGMVYYWPSYEWPKDEA